jgi:hypothetical protein
MTYKYQLNIDELAKRAGFAATPDQLATFATLVLDQVEEMIWWNDPTNKEMQGWAGFLVNHVHAMRPPQPRWWDVLDVS